MSGENELGWSGCEKVDGSLGDHLSCCGRQLLSETAQMRTSGFIFIKCS